MERLQITFGISIKYIIKTNKKITLMVFDSNNNNNDNNINKIIVKIKTVCTIEIISALNGWIF